jgi:type I restriction enzyme S subunit
VIIGRKGAYRGVHYSPTPFWVIDTAFYLETAAGIDQKWAYYSLLISDINGLDSGSAVPSTTRESFYSLPVLVPGLPEQRAIAEVLGALDDKIAANTELVATTDQLSRALFKSIAVESVQAPLSSTARFVNGKAFTKGASGTGRTVIRIAELTSGIGGSTVFSDAEVGGDHVAGPGDILFAWSGSLTLHRWFRIEGIVNQHIFKVIPAGYPSWLVYELLRERLDYFRGIAADKATTMGHIQRRHLDELVGVPSNSAIARMDLLMTSLWERALIAEQERESLAATRDVLLPQLMSGKLRVKDAEKVLEGVL